jgi:hypothetical protein
MSRPHSPRVTRICCVPPAEFPRRFILPDGSVKQVYPPGVHGGVIKPYKDVKDPSIDHWIEVHENENGEDEAADNLQCLRHAAAMIRVSPNTLYTYGKRLKSFRKVHNFDFFDMRELRRVDLPYLSGFRTVRDKLEAERKERRDRGEILRAGPHARGCPGDHDGKCERRRTQEWERTKVTQGILNGLGKKRQR